MAKEPSDLARRVSGELMETSGSDSIAANLTRAEIDQQIATAKKYPRSVANVMRQIETLATLDEDTAAECLYELPRDGKKIRGESIRFAEIVLQSWGNCRVAARITNVGDTHLEATGIYHDLETNMALSRSVPVRITNKHGVRYGDDMIGTASAAGISKALRNAILAGVPKGVWRPGSAAAQKVAMGDAATLTQRRTQALAKLKELGADHKTVFEILDIKGEADITLDVMLSLRGLYTALQTGESTVGQMLAEARAAKAPPETLGDKLGAGKKTLTPEAAQAGFDRAGIARELGDHDTETGEVIEGNAKPAAAGKKVAAPKAEAESDQGQDQGGANTAEQDAIDRNSGSGGAGETEGDQEIDQEASRQQPPPQPEPQQKDPLDQFAEAVPTLTSWDEIKKALSAVYKTQAFIDAEVFEQNAVRINAWEASQELQEKPTPGQDGTSFMCWLSWAEVQKVDPDLIEETLQKELARTEAFLAYNEAQQTKIIDAARAVAERLRANG